MAIAVARYVMERAINASVSSTLHSTNSSMKDSDNDGQSTSELIGALKFAASKSIRTSTIILAAFNVLAAFITAFSILYDCYFASKRCNPKFKASYVIIFHGRICADCGRKFCIKSIHPAETFPLVLAVGIVVQGLAFAGVQGEGLQSSNTKGCSLIAQFMWPGMWLRFLERINANESALFIVPYIQVVFGLECAIRSMRKLPFQARGKYDVTICSGAIVVMLIATWIPSHIDPQPDFCFASLVWFVSSFGEYALILLSISAGLMVLSALIIFIRLSTVNLIDQHQRITASRMVYYLVLGVVSLVSHTLCAVTIVLMLVGLCDPIFRYHNGRQGRSESWYDGNSGSEPVWTDEWTRSPIPQVEHRHDFIWTEEWSIMGSWKARDQNVGAK